MENKECLEYKNRLSEIQSLFKNSKTNSIVVSSIRDAEKCGKFKDLFEIKKYLLEQKLSEDIKDIIVIPFNNNCYHKNDLEQEICEINNPDKKILKYKLCMVRNGDFPNYIMNRFRDFKLEIGKNGTTKELIKNTFSIVCVIIMIDKKTNDSKNTSNLHQSDSRITVVNSGDGNINIDNSNIGSNNKIKLNSIFIKIIKWLGSLFLKILGI